MKLIITIPKDKYCYIQELEQGNTDYATTRMLYHAVKHGKPYDERKTGKWIVLDECANSGYYCSNCLKKLVKEGWSNTVKKIKFCPNCGAKMEGEADAD